MQIGTEEEVEIPLGEVTLTANIVLPQHQGVVIFAHGSGSSRLSPRNVAVSRELKKIGLGTVLFDLLTVEEDQEYSNRFDIPLLAERLVGVTEWLKAQNVFTNNRLGYFGASTGAAAALSAAAYVPNIDAVVSRGGRPDLAMSLLAKVEAPVLLIIGSRDTEVLDLNRQAYDQLRTEKRLEIVQGATHLFEEPGTMDEVIKLTAAWFRSHLQN